MTPVSRVRLVRAWRPSTGPTACALAGWRCALWGWRKGVPGGGAFHCCEGRLRSGAPPPPAARLPGGLSGVHHPRAADGGVRSWGPCIGPVAHLPCGGLRTTGVAGGVWIQAPPLPCCPPCQRAAGARWSRAVGAGVGVCGVCGACAVRAAWRGVAFRLSLWCPPLRCFVAVLCSPCACGAPFSARVPRSAAGFPLLLLWLRCSFPFPLLSVGSPSSLACTFSLPPLWCMSRSFSLPARLSLLLGPVRQRKDGGIWAFSGSARSPCNILFVAVAFSVARRITYLSLHLCLRVCVRSSPFVPYHGVLVRGGGGCVALAGTDLFVVFPRRPPC